MKPKLRVAFFITSLAGGGAERAVVNIVGALSKREDLQIFLIVNKFSGPYIDLIPENIKVIELGAAKLSLSLPLLIKSLRVIRPHVVVSHLWEINILAYFARLFGRLRYTLIMTEHSSISRSRTFGCNVLRKLTYPRSDAVVGVSEGITSEIRTILGVPSEKTLTIFNPVIGANFLALADQSIAHPWFEESIPIVLGVGRLSHEKRFDRFIETIAELSKTNQVRGLILGEGKTESSLKALARDLGVTENIQFLGFISNPLPLMKRASCLLLTSDVEGLPTVVIEAGAIGLPSIVTDCCAGVHEIRKAGAPVFIASSNDPASLSSLVRPHLFGSTPSEWDGQPYTEERSTNNWYDLIIKSRLQCHH